MTKYSFGEGRKECQHRFSFHLKELNGGYLVRCINPSCKDEFFAPTDEYEYMATTTDGRKIMRQLDYPKGYGHGV